jgi:hypothetical protein
MFRRGFKTEALALLEARLAKQRFVVPTSRRMGPSRPDWGNGWASANWTSL